MYFSSHSKFYFGGNTQFCEFQYIYKFAQPPPQVGYRIVTASQGNSSISPL